MKKLYFLVVLFVFVAVQIYGVHGAAIVTGTVFCDQCKDGHVSVFDYPLSDMRVTMVCPGNDGQMRVVGDETTNMLGSYGMTFEGTPDLSSCVVQISPKPNDQDNKCGAASGPPKSVKLMFSMFDMEMFSVEPLVSQPAQPMSYCSTSSPSSPPNNNPPVIALPPPTGSRPPPVSPATPVSPSAPTPAFRFPPMPRLPPMPPLTFLENSACSSDYWMKPEYKCYWRAVHPDMPVALVFGPIAAQKYGTDLTLHSGLMGKGDPYRTLLREGVTALLNSYNSLRFHYNALEVLHSFNGALTSGSTRNVLLTALRFKRANSGYGRVPCKFQSCK